MLEYITDILKRSEGMGKKEVARRTDLDRRTVKKYVGKQVDDLHKIRAAMPDVSNSELSSPSRELKKG